MHRGRKTMNYNPQAVREAYSQVAEEEDSEEACQDKWEKLKALEMQLCTKPELLGVGFHLLFVVRKI
jgi:hypothetical protein